MFEIATTDIFDNWLDNLRDITTRAKVTARIDRMSAGNYGDVKPVGAGISELRIHYGPGYRVYFTKRGQKIILLLCAGTKKRQNKDIKFAKQIDTEIIE